MSSFILNRSLAVNNAPVDKRRIEQNEQSLKSGPLRYLHAWLRFRGMTQRKLAEHLGVSEPTVSKWLKGDQAMNVAQLNSISHLLNAPLVSLLGPPKSAADEQAHSELISLLDVMHPEDREHIIAVVRSLAHPRSRG